MARHVMRFRFTSLLKLNGTLCHGRSNIFHAKFRPSEARQVANAGHPWGRGVVP